MYRHIITTLLVLATLTAHAQKTVIEGTVLDAQGKTVDAYVTVAPKGTGNILGFADTDAKGHYKLEFTTQADSVTVTASGLAIGNQVKIVANRSLRVDFSVKEKTVQLKEVSVRAQKIRQNRDTHNYCDVTATSRTEGGSSFLHHYVSLTFNYKFDAKKK